MNIIISSQIQNVGKSSLALMLTFAVTDKKNKVLLIDADIGRWTLTEVLLGKEFLLSKNKVGQAFPMNEFEYEFDFGYCDQYKGIELKKEYKYCIVDLDVTRSAVHNNYYFGNADVIIIPQPPWTEGKVKDWIIRFMEGLKKMQNVKKVMTYPIAVKYFSSDNALESLKWTNFEVYEAWKKLQDEKTYIKTNDNLQGLGYDENWAKYISVQKYDEAKVKKFVNESVKTLRKDLTQMGIEI
jgi:cellulose biosynthesis protein BcsQ